MNKKQRRAMRTKLKRMAKLSHGLERRAEPSPVLVLPPEGTNENQLKDSLRLQGLTVQQARSERRDNHAYRHSYPCKKKIKLSITRN